MTESPGFLNYTGPVDYNRIDLLLNDLKESPGFMTINKVTGRRVYAIVVECLENIIKYSAKESTGKLNIEPAISVIKRNNKIIIKSGNFVDAYRTDKIIQKIDEINSLDNDALDLMFEKQINKTNEKNDNGAGLGLIMMKLKSGNKIAFNVIRLKEGYSYLELTISVNEYLP